MPGRRTPESAWGQSWWLTAALGTMNALSLPSQLCLQCGSNYRNMEKCRVLVGKHFSWQAAAGSCHAGIHQGSQPVHPTPPTPNPHPIKAAPPFPTCLCLPRAASPEVLIISCTDFKSLRSQEQGGGGHPWEAPRPPLPLETR